MLRISLLFCSLFIFLFSQDVEAEITNININQRTDGSGMVDIYYDLIDYTGNFPSFNIGLEIQFEPDYINQDGNCAPTCNIFGEFATCDELIDYDVVDYSTCSSLEDSVFGCDCSGCDCVNDALGHEPIGPESLSGDYGESVIPGTNKHIIYYAPQDLYTTEATIQFVVSAHIVTSDLFGSWVTIPANELEFVGQTMIYNYEIMQKELTNAQFVEWIYTMDFSEYECYNSPDSSQILIDIANELSTCIPEDDENYDSNPIPSCSYMYNVCFGCITNSGFCDNSILELWEGECPITTGECNESMAVFEDCPSENPWDHLNEIESFQTQDISHNGTTFMISEGKGEYPLLLDFGQCLDKELLELFMDYWGIRMPTTGEWMKAAQQDPTRSWPWMASSCEIEGNNFCSGDSSMSGTEYCQSIIQECVFDGCFSNPDDPCVICMEENADEDDGTDNVPGTGDSGENDGIYDCDVEINAENFEDECSCADICLNSPCLIDCLTQQDYCIENFHDCMEIEGDGWNHDWNYENGCNMPTQNRFDDYSHFDCPDCDISVYEGDNFQQNVFMYWDSQQGVYLQRYHYIDWFNGQNSEEYFDMQPVGQYEHGKSPYELYDMIGNAPEIVIVNDNEFRLMGPSPFKEPIISLDMVNINGNQNQWGEFFDENNPHQSDNTDNVFRKFGLRLVRTVAE